MATQQKRYPHLVLTKSEAINLVKDLKIFVNGLDYPPRTIFGIATQAVARTFLRGKGLRVTKQACAGLITELATICARARNDDAKWFLACIDQWSKANMSNDPRFRDFAFSRSKSRNSGPFPNGLKFYPIDSLGVLVTMEESEEIVLMDGFFCHMFKDYGQLVNAIGEMWDQAKVIEVDLGIVTPSDLTNDDCIAIAEEWESQVKDVLTGHNEDLD